MKDKHKKEAELYRMVMDNHICPYGIKSKYLLQKNGYKVFDNKLKSRTDVDKFKDEHEVQTTPQTFINGKRIGGYEDLLVFFGHKKNNNYNNYIPVLTVFAVTLLLAFAASFKISNALFTKQALIWFITFTMSILALLKLQDVEKFSTMFIGYDLLAKRWVPYSYIYPFAEACSGFLMTADALSFISIPISFFIGSIGAASVFKAVYIDKRELKCACVGGDSKVPLGFISLTENIVMVMMAIYMLMK